MRITFTDENDEIWQIKSVKVSEADELVAAFQMLDTHIARFLRDLLKQGQKAERINLWVNLNSSTKQAISTILRLSGIAKKWDEFSVSDLNALLLDSEEQSLIRKANGYTVDDGNGEKLSDLSIHQQYLISLLYMLGGDDTKFSEALAVCKELSPDDLNIVLAGLHDVREGKSPELRRVKNELEIEDAQLAKFLSEAGFIEPASNTKTKKSRTTSHQV
jgi:hypothetical protein